MEEKGDWKEELFGEILRVLRVEEEKILNCFVFGSRALGTSTGNSDYDVYVVLDGFVSVLSPKNLAGGTPEEGVREVTLEKQGPRKDIDLVVVEKSEFVRLVEDHNLRSHLFLKCFPPEFCLKKSFSHECLFSPAKLRKEVFHFANSHHKKAEKLYERDVRRAKKALVHPFRVFLYSVEMLEKEGDIKNFTAGNEFHREIMQAETNNWNETFEFYLNKLEPILQKFKNLACISEQFCVEGEHPIVRLLNNHENLKNASIEILSHFFARFLCVKIVERKSEEEGLQIIEFQQDNHFTPSKDIFGNSCNGSVFARKKSHQNCGEWKLICQPVKVFHEWSTENSIFDSSREFAPQKIEWLDEGKISKHIRYKNFLPLIFKLN